MVYNTQFNLDHLENVSCDTIQMVSPGGDITGSLESAGPSFPIKIMVGNLVNWSQRVLYTVSCYSSTVYCLQQYDNSQCAKSLQTTLRQDYHAAVNEYSAAAVAFVVTLASSCHLSLCFGYIIMQRLQKQTLS